MISYVQIATQISSKLLKEVGLLLRSPDLEPYQMNVIDIQKQQEEPIRFKVLVRHACTVNDYQVIAQHLEALLKPTCSCTAEDLLNELIYNTASASSVYEDVVGRLCEIVLLDPERVRRHLLPSQCRDGYEWMYSLADFTDPCTGEYDQELHRFIIEICEAKCRGSFTLMRYGQQTEETRKNTGLLPILPKYTTGYTPYWDSINKLKSKQSDDMQAIHQMQLEIDTQGTCSTTLVYTYPLKKLIKECSNYDRITQYSSCFSPVAKLWYRLQYVGWGMNRIYIVQKPTWQTFTLMSLAAGSIVVFICSNQEMLDFLCNNAAILKQYNDVAIVILTMSEAKFLKDIVREFRTTYVFNGIAIEENKVNSGIAKLLNDTLESDENSDIHHQKDSFLKCYRDLSTCGDIPRLGTGNYDPIQRKYLAALALDLPTHIAHVDLDKAVGQTELKQYIQRLVKTHTYECIRKKTTVTSECLALIGSRGCGKTYFSKLISDVFQQNHITKPTNKKAYIQCNATSLIGMFQGTSTAKVRDLFAENIGSTIILENLSSVLSHDDYGKQVIIEVIAQISSIAEYTSVILTDTDDGLSLLLEKYPELETLIHIIHLHDYTPDELATIYRQQLEHTYNYQLNNANPLQAICENLRIITGDSSADGAIVNNAHYVSMAIHETIQAHANRCTQPDDILLQTDVYQGFHEITEKYKRGELLCNTEFNFRTTTSTRCSDIIGNSAAMKSLKRIVQYIKDPLSYFLVGAELPRGILLSGAPGTGKTLMARALAAEAGIPFCYVSGSEFVQKYVGEGARKIRNLFREARKRKSCIIFIDEIDAIGGKRGDDTSSSSKESDRTLNQLLTEMDGFNKSDDQIFILAATNLVEKLDPALLRPGRFDEIISVELPTKAERVELFKAFTKEHFELTEAQLNTLASITSGCSGACIQGIVAQARLLAGEAQTYKAIVPYDYLLQSASDSIVGHVQSPICNEDNKRRIAYHEAGHALLTRIVKGSGSVHKVTILPHANGSLGLSWQQEENEHLHTKDSLLDEVQILLAGYVSEQECLGSTSTGVQNDLERATILLRKMICQYGMYPRKWFQTSEEITQDNQATLERTLNDEMISARNNVTDILQHERKCLDALAAELLKDEEISGDTLDTIFSNFHS